MARTGAEGAGALGFGATTHYAADGVGATLEMTVQPRENLTAGAQVPEGTLTLDRAGHDTVVLPVAGLIGCVA